MIRRILFYLFFWSVFIACLISDLAILSGSAVAAVPKTLTTIDPSQVPLDDAVIMGNKNAPYRFIIFQDPDCPHCRKMHREIRKLTDATQDIVFYVKMFPLSAHRGAYEKSRVIVCEKSLAVLEDAFEQKKLPAAKCDSSALDQSIKFGEKLGLPGIPALILPDGRVILGFQNVEAILSTIGFNYEKVEDNLNFFARRDSARKKVADYLAQQTTGSEEAALLEAARTNSLAAYRTFLEKFPNSKYKTEVEGYTNWHNNARIVVSSSLGSDAKDARVRQIGDTIARKNPSLVYVPNLSELDSKARADGALVIVADRLQQMARSSQWPSSLESALAVNAGKYKTSDLVVAGFTGIIIDALFRTLTHSGNSALEWTILITAPNGQSTLDAQYRRAYFSNSLEGLFGDERFSSYAEEALLLSWLAKQSAVSDPFYNVLLQRGDGVFACSAIKASYRFKKILSESELADFCQISLLRTLIKEASVQTK